MSTYRNLCGGALLVLGLFGVSCASTPPAKPKSSPEQIQQDNHLGEGLAGRLEPHLEIREIDSSVSAFLNEMAQNLVNQSKYFADSSVQVFAISQSGSSSWKNYAIPGIRIYVSVKALRKIRYENQLAALFSVQLAHIWNRHLLTRLEEESYQASRSDIKKMLRFSPLENQTSIEAGVNIMYLSGYDPRGMLNYWRLYQKESGNTPYSAEELQLYIQKTRQAIRSLSPLLNPIVKSEKFIQIQESLKKL